MNRLENTGKLEFKVEIFLFISTLFCCLIQLNILNKIRFFDTSFNIILIYVVLLSVFFERKYILKHIIFMSIIMDIFIGRILFFNIIIYFFINYLINLIKDYIYEYNFYGATYYILTSSVLYEIYCLIFKIFIINNINLVKSLYNVVIQILFNFIFGVLIYMFLVNKKIKKEKIC